MSHFAYRITFKLALFIYSAHILLTVINTGHKKKVSCFIEFKVEQEQKTVNKYILINYYYEKCHEKVLQNCVGIVIETYNLVQAVGKWCLRKWYIFKLKNKEWIRICQSKKYHVQRLSKKKLVTFKELKKVSVVLSIGNAWR